MVFELKYNGCNTNKLHEELIRSGVGERMIITSKLILVDNIQVNETTLGFKDIIKTITQLEDEEPATTYQKRRVEQEPIEEGSEEIHEVTYWDDYTTETLALIAQVDACVAAHDCTPLPVPSDNNDTALIKLVFTLMDEIDTLKTQVGGA